MIQVLVFWVPGAPKTTGSLSARAPKCHCSPQCRGYARLPQLRDSEGSKRWRKLVAYQAERAMAIGPVIPKLLPNGKMVALTGWVALEILYVLPAVDLLAQGAGDLDKLDRNVFDALQDAQVFENDAQVARCMSEKTALEVNMSSGWGVNVKVMVLGEGG